MLLAGFINNGAALLQSLYPAEEARNIMLLLCCGRLGTQRYTHIVEPSFEVPSSITDILKSDMDRLVRGEPVQYVLGKTCFRGHDFKVDRRVLIPRPETEQLVELVLKKIRPGDRVLDLCTGSGCIAWSLALESEASEIVGIDISRDALDVAGNQYSDRRVHFVEGDILGPPSDKRMGKFDVIVSNPPYILNGEKPDMRTNVLDYEPGLALFVPDEDPLRFYKAITAWTADLLNDGGMGAVEINERFGKETVDLFRTAGFTDVQAVEDIFGKNRFVSFRK